MKYHELLSDFIEESGLTLTEISKRLEEEKGITIDRSYISKLKTGSKSPASDEVTIALAEITGGDPDKLLKASYLNKLPGSVKEMFQDEQTLKNFIEEVDQLLLDPKLPLDFFYEGVEKTLRKLKGEWNDVKKQYMENEI